MSRSVPRRRRSPSWLILAILGSVAVLGFALSDTSSSPTPADVTVESFATGLEFPWGMAFLPDGRLLVTERNGTVRIVDTAGTVSDPLGGVPEVRASGQGGLLDVALHPDYAANGWIYLTYSDLHDGRGMTALMRAKLDGSTLVDQEVLYRADNQFYTSRGQHFGSRIVFDGEGYVYFSVGDRGDRDNAQNLGMPNGKVHRLHDDGRIPEDNPFVDTPDALPTIWSYGHRNQQGMAIHPATGEIWATEHGPRGGDELNHVRRGLNFGWPVITYGINYNGTSITDLTEKEGMEQPALQWTPSIAVCGIDFYQGNAFPDWQDDLLVTSLRYDNVRRVRINGSTAVDEEIIYEGDRARDVQTGPDGYVYIALENPGEIVRLMPSR